MRSVLTERPAGRHPDIFRRLIRLAAPALCALALAACGGSDDNPNLPPEGDTTPVLGLAALQGPLTNPANGHVYFRLASADWTTYLDTDLRPTDFGIVDASSTDIAVGAARTCPASLFCTYSSG